MTPHRDYLLSLPLPWRKRPDPTVAALRELRDVVAGLPAYGLIPSRRGALSRVAVLAAIGEALTKAEAR